jgi:hypothetical protein
MINIPKNDYVTPKEVREHVLQLICNAFLQGDGDRRIFKGFCGSSTDSVITPYVNDTGFVRKSATIEKPYEVIRGCELSRAFDELIDAGYYMYRRIDPETRADSFAAGKKPFMIGWERVSRGTKYKMD